MGSDPPDPNVLSHSPAYEDRPPTAGLVKGSIIFSDGSRFHFREFLRLGELVIRLKYGSHYVSETGSLIFRYDNALDAAASTLRAIPSISICPTALCTLNRRC